MPRESAPVRWLAAAVSVAALALALTAAPAGAQKCTLGWDTPRWVDRPPSACDHLAVAGRVAAPVAAGPLGRVWFAHQDGGAWQLASRAGNRVQDGPQLALDGTPAAMVAGPDGALYVAGGRTVARWTGTGAPQTFALPAPLASFAGAGGLPLAQMASGAGGVWVGVNGGLVKLDAGGVRSVVGTQRRPRGGLALGGDGALWFSAGSALGRLDPGSNAVAYLGVSPAADGAVAAAPRGGGGIWYASRADGSVNVRSFSGAVTSYGVYGAPLGLVAGPGRYSVWASGGNGSRDWVARLATTGHPGGHPAGLPCAWADPIACGVNVRGGHAGDVAYFNSRETVLGGLAFDSDDDVQFSQNGY